MSHNGRNRRSKSKEKRQKVTFDGKLTEEEQLLDIDLEQEEDEEAIIEKRRQEREKLVEKLKSQFVAAQIEDGANSVDSSISSPSKQKELEEGEADDDEDEEVLQFDFEASMNAKKKTISNIQPSSSANQLAQTAQISLAAEEESTIDSCDKEKLEIIKTKEKKCLDTSFDMFADDEEYEHKSKNLLQVTEVSKVDLNNGKYLLDNWDDAEGYYSNLKYIYFDLRCNKKSL